MNQLLNGHSTTQSDPLASLAGRLIDPHDRERYASVISYVRALPPSDDFRQLAELLGLLSLLGQRLPDALAEFLEALREQTKATDEYHQRLSGLPKEIAAGIDPAAIARGMSESFRQQISVSGLYEATTLLKTSVCDVRVLSGQIMTELKPVGNQYRTLAATISDDLARLTDASVALQKHNARLIAQQREKSWTLYGLLVLVCLLAGFAAGLAWK